MPRITAKQLETLRMQDIQDLHRLGTGATIVVSDPENLTKDSLENFRQFAAGVDHISCPVDSVELISKLQQIPSNRSVAGTPPSTEHFNSSPTTIADDLDEARISSSVAQDANWFIQELETMGGRAFRANNSQSGDWKIYNDRAELRRWINFRLFQYRMRQTTKTFREYQNGIRHRNRLMELRLSKQTKLDEWEEYRSYEYERHSKIEQGLETMRDDGRAKEFAASANTIECTKTRLPKSRNLLRWIDMQSVEIGAEHLCPGSQNVRTGWEATHFFICKRIAFPDNQDDLFKPDDRTLLHKFARWIKVQLSKPDFRRVQTLNLKRNRCISSQAVFPRRSERISRQSPRRSARIRALRQVKYC